MKMREILFRGKREDNGEWVYGSLHIEYGETDRNGNKTLNYRILGMRGECDYVNPETVGQYTGLTDKNGTKIFEGDIVEGQFSQKPYLVCFGEYTYTDDYGDEKEAWGWYDQDIKGRITAFRVPEVWATVIGNTHDNPEMIGE